MTTHDPQVLRENRTKGNKRDGKIKIQCPNKQERGRKEKGTNDTERIRKKCGQNNNETSIRHNKIEQYREHDQGENKKSRL